MISILLLQFLVLLVFDVYFNYIVFFCCRFDNENSIFYVFLMFKIYIVCLNLMIIMKKVKVNKFRGKFYQNLWIVLCDSYECCDIDYILGSRLFLWCIYFLRLKYYILVFQRYSVFFSQVFILGMEYYFIGMYVYFSFVLCCLNVINEFYFELFYFQYMRFFLVFLSNFG